MVGKKRYKEGHFFGMGIAIGMPIGVPIGLMLGSIALGLVFSLPIGLAIGGIMEKNYNPNPIRLTEEEKTNRRKWSWLILITGFILLAGLSIVYFFLK